MAHDAENERDRVVAGEIYGTVVYLTVLVLLEEDRSTASAAIGILIATGIVFWLAHVYAYLVPRLAATGRLRGSGIVRTAADQLGILVAVVVPVVPLALAVAGVYSDAIAYRVAVALGLGALGVLAFREGVSAGLTWWRASGMAAVLVAAGAGLVALELSLH